MKRLSITLTDSQNMRLETITEITGATKQSIISIALTEWITNNYENIIKYYDEPTEEKE